MGLWQHILFCRWVFISKSGNAPGGKKIHRCEAATAATRAMRINAYVRVSVHDVVERAIRRTTTKVRLEPNAEQDIGIQTCVHGC